MNLYPPYRPFSHACNYCNGYIKHKIWCPRSDYLQRLCENGLESLPMTATEVINFRKQKPMTRDEIDAEIKRLEALRDELPPQWPKEGDTVFFLGSNGGIKERKWLNKGYGLFQWETLNRGSIKRTREDAEIADKKRIAMTEWNNLAGEQSWVNWESHQQQKFYPQYFHENEKWVFYAATTRQTWPLAYHKTQSECEAAVEKMGERMDWILS